MRIDAKGKQCPLPVIMAKKELDAGTQDVEIVVDGQIQADNLIRLGESIGRAVVSADPFEGCLLVKFANGETVKVDDAKFENCNINTGKDYAVFFNKEILGGGDDTLGLSLAKMAIFTLSESDQLPAYVLFMNGGVKLTTGIEPQIVENLQSMIEKGTKVLVCGTCLNYYEVKDDLKVGQISNMYDILGAMQEVSKVITL
jgi:selenium metabolism protein YedF